MAGDVKAKLTIVVLNYMNYMETFNCVESILPQEKVNFDIVIVDNGSGNESYSSLKKKYRDIDKIYILKAGKNYGFAKGNNIGINYARKKLGADYVLLLNSDTILLGNDYLYQMMLADRKNVGVIGSKIIERNGQERPENEGYVDFPATLYYYLYLLCNDWGWIKSAQLYKKKVKRYKTKKYLSGCNLLLTPQYLDIYDGLYDKTFLYSEEKILLIRCKMAGLEMVKTEQAALKHIGMQSTKYLFGNRNSMIERNMRISYKYVVLNSLISIFVNLMKR